MADKSTSQKWLVKFSLTVFWPPYFWERIKRTVTSSVSFERGFSKLDFQT
jgi:hypothetical protein